MSTAINLIPVRRFSLYQAFLKLTRHPKFEFVARVVFWVSLTPYIGSGIEFVTGAEVYEFTEELMKFIATFSTFTFAVVYTLAFSIYEFFQYVENYGSHMGIYYWDFIYFRIFCIIEHIVFLSIHLYAKRVANKYDSIATRIRIRMIGFSIAWFYHMFHNELFGKLVAEKVFNIPM